MKPTRSLPVLVDQEKSASPRRTRKTQFGGVTRPWAAPNLVMKESKSTTALPAIDRRQLATPAPPHFYGDNHSIFEDSLLEHAPAKLPHLRDPAVFAVFGSAPRVYEDGLFGPARSDRVEIDGHDVTRASYLGSLPLPKSSFARGTTPHAS